MSKYKKGQIVVLKSDRSINGAVVDIVEGLPENRYSVFTANGLQSYYESQIDPEVIQNDIEFVSAERFHANITASLIRNPSLDESVNLSSLLK